MGDWGVGTKSPGVTNSTSFLEAVPVSTRVVGSVINRVLYVFVRIRTIVAKHGSNIVGMTRTFFSKKYDRKCELTSNR